MSDRGSVKRGGLVTEEEALLTVDLCKDQTAALNEHRDGGGWGGGHSRRLVMSVVGCGRMAKPSDSLEGEQEDTVVWVS